MHPLVPFLLGQKHPKGQILVNNQKCLRTGDIEEVGDDVHLTFFEMLGNWSLGGYWKEDAIKWSYDFLTDKKWLGLNKNKLAVSIFKGDKDAPRDKESYNIWLKLGIPKENIYFFGKEDNWWGPVGKTGPCGPDTEMFYWVGKGKPKKLTSSDNKSNWIEIWNNVFMEYNKDKRLILVDGMYCLYDENFKIDKELLDFLHRFNTHYILTVNGFKEKGRKLVKSGEYEFNWEAFSLEEEGIKKNNPEYFKILLKKFSLVPEEVIYFDHDKKSVETAKKLGILSKHYTNLKTIKKFIKDNLDVFIPLKQKNVDTGMGVERVTAILEGKDNVYETSLFLSIIKKIKKLSKNKDEISIRKIADHIRTSVFILGEGITPSNLEQGYVLRRLIRVAIRHGNLLKIKDKFCKEIANEVIDIYKKDYPYLKDKKDFIFKELEKEEERFTRTLEKGLNKFNRFSKNKKISGEEAFLLFQSFGFPIEMTLELAKEKKIKVDEKGYEKELKKHQKLSRTATKGKFGSGLADHSEQVTKLHTATHILNEALRRVLKKDIHQKGSNITAERARFDFNFDRKLTEEEIKKVEDMVNEQIKKKLDVKEEVMSVKEAKEKGAHGIFDEKYGDKISVYSIGNFSKEICAGPHVKNTKELGKFKIKKQESVGAGARRIKAVLE